MPYFSAEEFESSFEKIVDAAGSILNESQQQDWEIKEIHLIAREGPEDEKVICEYVIRNGQRVMECRRT